MRKEIVRFRYKKTIIIPVDSTDEGYTVSIDEYITGVLIRKKPREGILIRRAILNKDGSVSITSPDLFFLFDNLSEFETLKLS